MTVYPIQANMTRGEATPLVHARGDTEHYSGALARARNVVVTRYGGVTRVPGSLYEGPTKSNSTKSRLLPFEFNRTQVFALEFGNLYVRFWTPDGRIETSPGVAYEVTTPYAEADLKNIRVRQSGDVVYIWCKKTGTPPAGAYQPRTLTRTSDTNWTLAAFSTIGGPYLKENTLGTTLTPASYGSITPLMTGLTAPSGTVSSSGAFGDAWEAFDHDAGTDASMDPGGVGWLQYRQAGAAQVIADAYYITATPQDADVNTPSTWQLQGSNNGVTWITLDARRGQTGWTNGETRYYEFENSTAYEYYRFNFTAGGGGGGANSAIAELGIHRKASDQTPFNLTASSTTGINNGTGFQTSDVGRFIRLMGSDGVWRDAEIAARTSTTVVTIRLYGHSLPDLSPIARWQMGAFSEVSGWPTMGTFYEDRLGQGRTDADPLGMWFSVSADYDDYSQSSPLVDDDAISLRLTGGKLNELSWMVDLDDVVAGTAGSLRAVGRNNQNAAFGPSNARQKNETVAPSSDIEPVLVEEIILFIDFYESRLYEAAYTYEVEGYLAREASTLSEHLFNAGIAEIVYLSNPHKIVVCRRHDGKLIFFTYDREQKVAGATLVDYGGEVESICSLPGESGTDLWMVVKRTINGSTVRYVERMAEFWRSDLGAQVQPVFGACGGIYDGAADNTISVGTQLANTEVGIWADGNDIGDATVSAGGVLTLPSGIEGQEVVWGIRMPFEVQTLRLTNIGNKDGSGLGRKVDIAEAYVDLFETAGIEVGSLDVQDLLGHIDEVEEDPDDPKTLLTGMYPITVDDSWRNNGVLVITGDSMYPATIRAIQLGIDGEP